MGIATVHYLSMNVRDGQVVEPVAPVYEDTSYSYSVSSLQPEVDYTISWGDDTSTAFTTDVDGAWEGTHTYADPGDYTILVYVDETGQIAAEETITIAVD